MCFSAPVSFAAAAVLLPTGALAVRRAWRVDKRYVPLCLLPVLFGLQQFSEGMVWTTGAQSDTAGVGVWSLGYMFFAWLAWPVWVPVSVYFLETGRRKILYVAFAVAGGMLGALQYVPYFAHDGWLVTTFLTRAIRYEGVELLDFVTGRIGTYAIYLAIIIAPLLLARDRDVKIFGILVSGVFTVTYLFFTYAYISVFCFGGAVMSLYLVMMIFRRPTRRAGGNSLPDGGRQAPVRP